MSNSNDDIDRLEIEIINILYPGHAKGLAVTVNVGKVNSLKALINTQTTKARNNCNVEPDQPNDVHISFFNAGYRTAKNDLLDRVDKEVINIEYSADYTKMGKCDVCGDYEYSHAPDEHKDAGAKELKAIQRQRLQSLRESK